MKHADLQKLTSKELRDDMLLIVHDTQSEISYGLTLGELKRYILHGDAGKPFSPTPQKALDVDARLKLLAKMKKL